MGGRPFFSIIIPVYNVENYLGHCLDSVINQTVRNIEIICVDDGSTDSSPQILDRFKELDNRIIVIHKPNGGLSSARNAGMELAEGEYILFVDSDDMLRLDACEKLLIASMNRQPDIILFGTELFPIYDDVPSNVLRKELEIMDGMYFDNMTELPFTVNGAVPYVWNKCWKKDFLDRISLRFREDVKFGEDTPFLFSAYPRADRVHAIPDKLYRYRIGRQNSLMDQARKDMNWKAYAHLQIATLIITEWVKEGYLKKDTNRIGLWTREMMLDVLESRDVEPPVRKEVFLKFKALLDDNNIRFTKKTPRYSLATDRMKRMEKASKSMSFNPI